MVEERRLAKKNGYPSPVFDTVEDTHKAYNDSIAHIIDNI
jgi:hypothetical protein